MQKIWYLILLICLLCGLTSANKNITMYVQQNGIDQPKCMKGITSIPCYTVCYVLNQINNGSNYMFKTTDISVYVYLTYTQVINSLLYIQLRVNLHLNNTALDFISRPFLGSFVCLLLW